MTETCSTQCGEGHQPTYTAGDCILSHGKHSDGCQRYRTAKVGYVCIWHRDRLDTHTQDIHNLWLDLALILEHGSAPTETSVGGGRIKGEPPAPANLEALSLRDYRSTETGDDHIPSVPGVVGSWLLLFAEERPLDTVESREIQLPDPDEDGNPRIEQRIILPQSVMGQLDMLTTHHEWACSQLWIDDYWRELDELRKALKHCLRDRELPELGRCLHCDTDVVEREGAAVCPKCAAKWVTAQELARLKVGQKGAA